MELGQHIDRADKLRLRIKREQAKVDLLQSQLDEMEAEILRLLLDAKLDKASGKLATSWISETLVPTAEDWNEIERFVHKHKAYDLFERRLSSKAWRLRYEDGLLIPGTKPYTRVRLNLRTK